MANENSIQFLEAQLSDLPEIILLLADDELGKGREAAVSEKIDPAYLTAFHEIAADQNNELIVGKIGGKVAAVLQVTYIPNLTMKGTKRALIEGVRVSSELRGKGVGRMLFDFVINRAKNKGCKLVQLTTNKARPDAYRFYEAIGFKATHEGFKLPL